MLVKNFVNHQFLLFLLSSGLAAITNFISRIILGLWMSYTLSVAAAYICGMLTSYTLCRFFVFTAKQHKIHHQIFYFVLVSSMGFILTLAMSVLLFKHALFFIQNTFTREEVAHFIGICVPAFISYLGHKHWSFR